MIARPPPSLVDRAASLLTAAGAAAAALICIAIAALILLEVLLRNVFDSSTNVAVEFVGYGVAAMIFLGMGSAFQKGAMIRVTLLSGKLDANGLARRAIEIAVGIATLGISGLAIWFYAISVQRNYVRGYKSESMAEVPLWIPEGLMLLGLAIFWLQLLSYLLRVLRGGDLVGGGDE